MSTAGKVLAVLCVLMLGVWAVLLASVDQLNVNANKRLDDIKTQVAKLKTEVEEVQRTADLTLHKVNEEHVGIERDKRLVLARVSTAERQLSTTLENLSRKQIQLDNYKKALDTAKVSLDSRKAEKAKYEKDKADEEATVKRLQGENADLTGELLSLRTSFQKALAENQAEVEKQMKEKTALTRQASLGR